MIEQQTAESEAAAEEYAGGIICYRTTDPDSHHNAVKAAFLAGVQHTISLPRETA